MILWKKNKYFLKSESILKFDKKIYNFVTFKKKYIKKKFFIVISYKRKYGINFK